MGRGTDQADQFAEDAKQDQAGQGAEYLESQCLETQRCGKAGMKSRKDVQEVKMQRMTDKTRPGRGLSDQSSENATQDQAS